MLMNESITPKSLSYAYYGNIFTHSHLISPLCSCIFSGIDKYLEAGHKVEMFNRQTFQHDFEANQVNKAAAHQEVAEADDAAVDQMLGAFV